MEIPTMDQFSPWADKDRFWYLAQQLEGLKCLPGRTGFLFRQQYAIRFQQDRNGNVIMATAIPFHQGIEEYERVNIAAKALKYVKAKSANF